MHNYKRVEDHLYNHLYLEPQHSKMLRLLLKTVKPPNTSVAYLVVEGYVSYEEENLGIIHANWG